MNKTMEQRSETRFLLTQKPRGLLFLHAGDQCLPVRSIRDVSQTGISLLLDHSIGKGTQVVVEYRDGSNDIRVSGIVVWQNLSTVPATQSLHVLGINMFSPNMLLSFLQLR